MYCSGVWSPHGERGNLLLCDLAVLLLCIICNSSFLSVGIFNEGYPVGTRCLDFACPLGMFCDCGTSTTFFFSNNNLQINNFISAVE